MRRIITLMVLLVLLVAGCSSQELNKQQYYERGLDFLEKENARGAKIAFKKAIEKDQNYFEARYRLALAYMIENRYESAERELIKVLRLNPSYKEAHISLAKAYVHTGKIDNALKEIALYLKDRDDNPEAYEVAATAHAANKDYAEAEEALNKSIKISPESISAKTLLASVYMETGKISDAEILINEILEVEDSSKKAFFLLARIQHKKGDIDSMIKTYQKILDMNPEDIEAQFELGLTYVREDRLEKAKEIAIKLEETHKNRPEGSYLRGLVYYHEKKIDEALVSFQSAVRNHAIPEIHYYLGLCQLEKGNLEQALSEFRRVLDMEPDMVQARLLLAVTYLRKGRAEEAEKEALMVLDMDENNAFAHNLLGSSYLTLGKGDLAMEEFDRAIELDPKLVDAHIKKGAFNLMSGYVKKAEKEFIDAVRIAPDVLNTRIILAQYYIRNEKYREAIEILEDGLQDNPDDAVLYNMIGAAHLGLKDNTSAEKYFKMAIAANSGFFLSYLNLATVHVTSGDRDKAISEYQRVLEIDNENVRALLMLAKLMDAENKDKEALEYYRRAKEQKIPIVYLSLAGYYIRKNDHKEAINVLEEALRLDPKNVKAIDMKGRIYLADKKYEAALATYEKLSILSPEIGTRRIAGVYTSMGKYDIAISELNKLLDDKPDSAVILRQIANVNIMKKNYKEAEKIANKIISLKPASDDGYQLLAATYNAGGQFQKAVKVLKKAEKLNPEGLDIKTALGRTYIAAKDYKGAIDTFKKIEKSNPAYAPAYFFQASIFEEMGSKKAAAEMHEKVLGLSPNHIPSLNNLAYLYTDGYGDVEKAVEMARKAKRLAPKDGRITDTLGWTLYKTGNFDDAIKKFIEATYYLPNEPTIRYHLGLAYLKKGMDEKAEEQLKNAIRLGRQTAFPEFEDAEKLLVRMKRK